MNGFTWRCEACGAKGSVREERGFQLTEPVSELMEEIRAGKYGTKWQRLVEEEPEVAVNAELAFYVCGACGNWANEPDLSLYRPGEKTKDWPYPGKTEKGDIVASSEDLKQYFDRIRSYPHLCSRCGKRMRKQKLTGIRSIPCPNCGATISWEQMGFMCWD